MFVFILKHLIRNHKTILFMYYLYQGWFGLPLWGILSPRLSVWAFPVKILFKSITSHYIK